MIINVLSIFPELFSQFLRTSIIGKAISSKIVDVNLLNIRDFSKDKHKKVDDYPYGGGSGMVMMPQPLFDSIQAAKGKKNIPVVYFTPQGRLLNQSIVNFYSMASEIILLCGHYKEIDQRIRDSFVDDEISIGDYVLSGGEIPAMVFIDAVIRLQDGAISDIESALTDSHQDGSLGCPHYTRPADFCGLKVPEVLLSGNHREIEQWRKEQARKLTEERRPDLSH